MRKGAMQCDVFGCSHDHGQGVASGNDRPRGLWRRLCGCCRRKPRSAEDTPPYLGSNAQLVPVIGSRIVLLGLTLAVAFTLAAFAPAERTAYRLPSAQPTVADTLRFEVTAGDPLIVALPARVNGVEASYALEEAPALSWLVDRSFFYQTMRGERGVLSVHLRRTTESGAGTPVVLLVTITA